LIDRSWAAGDAGAGEIRGANVARASRLSIRSSIAARPAGRYRFKVVCRYEKFKPFFKAAIKAADSLALYSVWIFIEVN
jgi:hypothetical protein